MIFEKLETLATADNSIALFGIAAVLSLLYLIVTASRNHLRHVPGPFYSRFTTLPLKLAVLGGTRVHHVHALHRRYGRLVRIGPNELSVADPDAFKVIHRAGQATFPKSGWYRGQSDSPVRVLIDMQDNKQHAARRKLLSPGFTKSNLIRDWEGMVNDHSRKVVQRMKKDVDTRGEVDVYKWWTFFAADTSATVMFGESFGMMEAGERNKYSRDMAKVLVIGGLGYEIPLVGFICNKMPIVKNYFRTADTMVKYGQKAVDASRTADTERRNVFATMNAEARAEGGKKGSLSEIEIATEAGVLQVGGVDTTATTLTYLSWAVAKSPSVWQKLVAEVEPLTDEQLNDTYLSSLPYLNAVINETLRMWPAVPSNMPRVVPPRGTTLCGLEVPAGTIVGTQAWTIHRLPEHWGADAYEFKPERWLSLVGKEEISDAMKDAFVPWGGGSKICLGQHLAMMEMRIAVAMFAREFGPSLKVSNKTKALGMEVLNFFIMAPKPGVCWLSV